MDLISIDSVVYPFNKNRGISELHQGFFAMQQFALTDGLGETGVMVGVSPCASPDRAALSVEIVVCPNARSQS